MSNISIIGHITNSYNDLRYYKQSLHLIMNIKIKENGNIMADGCYNSGVSVIGNCVVYKISVSSIGNGFDEVSLTERKCTLVGLFKEQGLLIGPIVTVSLSVFGLVWIN